MTTHSRRLLASSLCGALIGGLGAALPATSASAEASPDRSTHATPDHARTKSSKPARPTITQARGGEFARLDFKLRGKGKKKWTRIQARGVQWSGDQRVGECHPPAFSSQGSWVGFHPGTSGEWSFQVRVRNKAGWSRWSKPSKRVTIH